MVEERLRELISRGVIIVDLQGAVSGQVNGLAVHEFGDFSFGRPSRITARTFLGQRGVTSIDRESQLSGKIHDKGVLDPERLPRLEVRAGQAAIAFREHLLRAGIRRCRRATAPRWQSCARSSRAWPTRPSGRTWR